MKFKDISATKELKESTLKNAKAGKKVSKAVKIRTLSAITAALVIIVGISFLAPSLFKSERKKSAEEKSNMYADASESTGDEKTNAADDAAPKYTSGEADTAYARYADAADDGDISLYSGEALYSLEGDKGGAIYGTESDSISEPSATVPDSSNQQGATHMTAAKLNDNIYFTEWLKTVSDTNQLFTNGYSPLMLSTSNRISVSVKSENGSPCDLVLAELLDEQGNVISKSYTNKEGKAYLFYKWISGENGTPKAVRVSGSIKILSSLTEEVTFTLNSGVAQKTLDVMFMIDSTGSMGDEMTYLANELSELLTGLSVKPRISVNFYRDVGDEYVTKTNAFTSDINTAISQLKAEKANGGGDYAEAVDKALEKVVSAEWNGASEKICFLVLDAPAHSSEASVRTSIANSVKAMAEKGIRLIPVIASSADIETEITTRQIAMLTGGEYVFITNHSGIGGEHIEATTDIEYEVKPLIQVLTDVINDYM